MKPRYSGGHSLAILVVVLGAGCGGVATHPRSPEPTGPPAPSFGRAASYETGRDPTSLVVADLDGDGKGDIVTVDTASVSVLLNRGRAFARNDYPAGGVSAAVADVDGQGGLDIVVATGRKTVSVLLNRGNGSFRAGRDYQTAPQPAAIALGDLNGDGEPDIATANQAAVSVLLNRGGGTFARRADYPAGDAPMSVAIADLNGDGTPDLATASYEGSSGLLFNRGDGTFQPGHPYDDTSGPSWVVPVDLNGDGRQDLAVASNDETGDFSDEEGGPTLYPSWVYGLSNRGNGHLKHAKTYVQTGGYDDGITAPGAHDMDGDGRGDLVFGYWLGWADSGVVSVLLSSGKDRFGERVDYPVGAQDYEFLVAIGDVNGDARPDVAVANSQGRRVSVFLNTPGLCTVQDVSAGGLRGEITLEQARRALERGHCRVGDVREETGTGEPGGRVLEQKPKFGAVLPAGARVDLVVSRGRKR